MYVRRDYSRNYYGGGSPRRSRILFILVFMAAIVGFVALVYARFDQFQVAALSWIGLPPVPTNLPGEDAVEGLQKMADGDLRGAELDLRRAVQQRPDNVDYLYEYGRVLMELDRTDDAVAIADQAIAAAPADVRGYALKAMALRWTSPAEAVPIALAAEGIDPNFPPIYAAKAIAYTQIGRYSLAIEAAEKGLEIDDKSADVHRAFAWPLVLVGRYGEAVEHLEIATSLQPNLPSTWFELANEYKSRLNQHRDALDIYDYMINNLTLSNDDLAKANLRICETLANMPEADFDKAETYCSRALQIKPDYGPAFRERGRMQYNRRNYEGAIESFETCAELEANFTDASKDLECWGLRGLAHYWMADCTAAWDLLNEAVSIARNKGLVVEEEGGLLGQINIGLYNVTERCPGYDNQPTPTPVPPTVVPPTPIGSL